MKEKDDKSKPTRFELEGAKLRKVDKIKSRKKEREMRQKNETILEEPMNKTSYDKRNERTSAR